MVDRAAEGKTVLLASHQINEVERVADIVAIFHEGRVLLVERLDLLKEQIREVTLTLHAHGEPPALDGLIDQECRGRQCRMLVRQSGDMSMADLDRDSSVADVEIRVPSLEEIFVGYLAGRKTT